MPRRPDSSRAILLTALLLGNVAAASQREVAQEPAAPQSVDADQLAAAIGRLGDLDYAARTDAARTIRRTAPAQAVPALLRTVAEYADGYVRYRALVLLTGFNDPRTKDAMRASLVSPNDRLRAVAYSYFEHHPDRGMVDGLMAALETEVGEFVRPSLVRTLAAHAGANGDPRLRQLLLREAKRGEDYFRSAVIEALGDYQARYAFDTLVEAATLDGPLQDDAVLALGKLGDKRGLDVLARLQRTAAPSMQPTVATAICLLGSRCDAHIMYLAETLKFADSNGGFQELIRSAAAGLGALAVAGGHDEAVASLFDIGIPSRDPTRSPVSLSLATVALRNTPLLLQVLGGRPDRADAIALVGEGFDMLEEDLDKEAFFAAVRRAYWDAPDGSPTRQLTQTLIGKLDF